MFGVSLFILLWLYICGSFIASFMIRRWYGAKALIVNGEFVMLKTVNMSAICGYEW